MSNPSLFLSGSREERKRGEGGRVRTVLNVISILVEFIPVHN